MTESTDDMKDYFFCGIGGSGMLPLALLVRACGARVSGSDRGLDSGREEEKSAFLRSLGIALYPQDGSGIVHADQILVTSAAVEETVADVVAAKAAGASRITRAALLAGLFNNAPLPVGIAGTSGKSTTTAMAGWIMHSAGLDPRVMNGAVMKNFVAPGNPFAAARPGKGPAFVSEVDESDGSIALFRPQVAVVNNITPDHKPMDELRQLFSGFADRARTCILNLDDGETAAMADVLKDRSLTYSLRRPDADFRAADIRFEPYCTGFSVICRGQRVPSAIRLAVPGLHNVSNALAAMAAVSAAGVSPEVSARALNGFAGIRRRFELAGTCKGVTVIDDFAHNPDKIRATLDTLHAFPGRVLVMFQPHGFGPLGKMQAGFVSCFSENLDDDDVLFVTEPVYFGGTADRTVSVRDIVRDIAASGRRVHAVPDRDACLDSLVSMARPGDRIVIMGARDDTLSGFAADVLAEL